MKTDENKPDYIAESAEALEMLGKGYNNDPIPPSEFISTVSGFTLAPDALINEYGYVTALVWGVTWRFCQMKDGVCRASHEKVAKRLGMSERTIIRHLETLCDGGYLFDMTPDLKNKPHIYADTGKIKVRMNLSAMTESHPAMTESHPAMTESHPQGDRESVEESIKEDDKRIFSELEKLIGSLNSNTPKFVDTWLEKHTVNRVLQAIGVANEKGARSVKYVDEVLISWEANGYPKTRDEKVKNKKNQYSQDGQVSLLRTIN